MEGGGRVEFDFAGSLQLARDLWALADEILTEDNGREQQFTTAKEKWLGPYGEQFVGRRSDERTSRGTVVSAMRDDARAWAQAWATAMNQQNKNNRAAEVERIRDDRGLLEQGSDFFFGDDSDDQVPMPPEPAVPTPPGFAPTMSEIRY